MSWLCLILEVCEVSKFVSRHSSFHSDRQNHGLKFSKILLISWCNFNAIYSKLISVEKAAEENIAERKRVLVIDDDPSNLTLARAHAV